MSTSRMRSKATGDQMHREPDTTTLERDRITGETPDPQETANRTCLAGRMKRIEREIDNLRHQLREQRPPVTDTEEHLDRIITKHISSILEKVIESVVAAATDILDASREIGAPRAEIGHDLPPHAKCRSAMPVPPSSMVSNREHEILARLLEGKSNREISKVVGISEKTVKNHLWKIYRKLGVKSRSQLFHYMMSR
jgi:DNA-binding CsgD family transcriptional regulator